MITNFESLSPEEKLPIIESSVAYGKWVAASIHSYRTRHGWSDQKFIRFRDHVVRDLENCETAGDVIAKLSMRSLRMGLEGAPCECIAFMNASFADVLSRKEATDLIVSSMNSYIPDEKDRRERQERRDRELAFWESLSSQEFVP